MYRIKTLRGTIFCPPIKYTKEFVERLAGTVDGYLPTLIRDNNALPILPMWQLSSPDEKEVLAFTGEKIDLVRSIETEIGDEQIFAFCERCQAVFRRILEVTGYICTRLALAPSVIVTENGERPTSLFNKLFAVREFDHTLLDSSNFSQVYRVDRAIGKKVIKINLVANFKTENELISTVNGNQLRLRYMCDFDVNTMAHPDYKFSFLDLNEFFKTAPTYFTDFYNLYFA